MIRLIRDQQYFGPDINLNSNFSDVFCAGVYLFCSLFSPCLEQASKNPILVLSPFFNSVRCFNRISDILVFPRCGHGNNWIRLLILFALIVSANLFENSVRAATFTYFYDTLNRLTGVVYSDGSRESYSYDPSGNRLSRVTLAATNAADAVPPSVPSDLVTNNFTPSQLSISWNHALDTGGAGLAGYYIYVNDALAGVSTDTNFTFLGLSPASEYCLTVAAFDHDNNVSAQSSAICFITPAFRPPHLFPNGFTNGSFRIIAFGGTPGPYDVFGSSNLVDWKKETNVSLPLTNGNILRPLDLQGGHQHFYRLGWRTNAP